MRSRVFMVALTVALVLGLAVGGGGWRTAAQFNPQPEPPALQHFALVTLGAGQFARVNVANVSDPAGVRHPPDPGRVEIAFYNREGTLLAETTVTLAPGQGTCFDYTPPPDDTSPQPGSQGVTTPPRDDGCVNTPPPDDNSPPPDDNLVRARVRVLNRTRGAGIVSAMEIADAEMGTSQIVSPAELVGFNPQPEPPARGGRLR